MANIVDLLIGLGIDSEEYESGLAGADQASSGFIDRLTGPLTTAVVGAFATGGAAVAGFAANAVSEFSTFQASMNEVFTLLPGISQDAMGDMTDQVKQFSKDFGVLPEDVVPALYQSLSAGVPADNVFAFLEDANKAATAGVADLDVAVNGISSVVNAYGSDIIDAGKASDLLFTTVKLGKTNFEELSSSIFNVTPAASAAGVKFESVTAALAAMTLQGVPTSVATTKLRGAINELSQAGTKTDKIFREVAGKSFKEFIASGGDLQGALQLLEQHAADTNVGINDLFGSVDAGSAALLLTGKGTDAFTNALNGMNTSAGATDAAFATMNTGITDAIDDLKASFAVFTLDVGERLAPFVQFVADQLGVYLPLALDTAMQFIDRVSGAVNNLILVFDSSGGSVTALFTIFEDGSSSFTSFLEALGVGEDAALAINNAFLAIINAVKPLMPYIDQLGALIGDNLQPILLAVGTVIGVVVIGAIASFVASIVAAVAPILAIIAILATLYAAYESNFFGIRDIVNTVMTFIGDLFTTVVGNISAFWAEHGAAIMETARNAFTFVYTIVKFYIDAVAAIIKAFVTAATFIWTNYGTQITQIATNFWNIIKGVFSAAFTLISGFFKAFTQLFAGDFRGFGNTLWNTAKTFTTQIWNVIKLAFENIRLTTIIAWDLIYRAIQASLNSVVGWVAQTFIAVLNNIRGLGAKAASAAASVGDSIANGIVEGIKNGASAIINAAKSAAMAALDAAKKAIGFGSPAKKAIPIGVSFGQGLVIGVERMIGAVANAGANAGRALISNATATAPAITGSATSAPAMGVAGANGTGLTQNYQIDAHYAKYEDERTLRDTIRMESMINAPVAA
jgi:TP901 family phage tail tape measure protein